MRDRRYTSYRFGKFLDKLSMGVSVAAALIIILALAVEIKPSEKDAGTEEKTCAVQEK